LLDLRWAAAPTVAKWWIQQVLRIEPTHPKRPHCHQRAPVLGTTEHVTVLPVGVDPADVIRTACRFVRAKSMPAAMPS
jgi:hypothetical protein